MEFKLKNLPKSEVEINVTLPFSEFEPHLKRAASLISEKVKIEGFRPGKAPYEVVKNRLGEFSIYEEAAELAVRKTYPEVVEKIGKEQSGAGEDGSKKDFTPIGRPEITITKLAPGDDLQYKVKVALLPEVTLPDYKRIAARVRQKEKKELHVEEQEVAKAIEWIRESRSPLVAVDRPAQMGDTAEIDFTVRHGGVKIEGGESKNHPLVIGKGKFLPGFEEQLIGMRAGEEKNFTLVSPQDWHDKSVAGKVLDFAVALKMVGERRLPELNDEFAKSLGNFENLDSLKKSVQEGIAREKEEKETQRIRGTIIEEISKEAVADIPPVLIASELEKMLNELKSGVDGMGMKWEDYLVHIKKTVEDLKKEWEQDAERRVKAALVLKKISLIEKIEPSEEEIKERADKYLSQFKSVDNAVRTIDPEDLREYTRGVLRNEKVFELLENV